MTTIEAGSAYAAILKADVSQVLHNALTWGDPNLKLAGSEQIVTMSLQAAGFENPIHISDELAVSAQHFWHARPEPNFYSRWSAIHANKTIYSFFTGPSPIEEPSNMFIALKPIDISYGLHYAAEPLQDWRKQALESGEITDIATPVILEASLHEEEEEQTVEVVQNPIEIPLLRALHEAVLLKLALQREF